MPVFLSLLYSYLDQDLVLVCFCFHRTVDMETNDQVEHSNEDRNSNVDQKSSKPCYYPSQISVAELLFERIELILWHHHKKKRLRDFKKFDFRIYTARFVMLEKQGIVRLSEPDAKCFGSKQYENLSDLYNVAESKVWKYGKSEDLEKNLTDLKKDVGENPDKLFLIVADEADWGTTGEESANNKLVNCWNNKKNVIILLVTATPWNLLTTNTRLPDLIVARRKIEDNQLVVLSEKDGQHFCFDKNNVDVTHLVGQKRKLHVIMWDENYENRLTKGLFVKLRVPQEVGKEETWLKLGMMQMSENENYEALVGTSKKEEAVSLYISGKNNVVQIETEDRKKKCVAVRRNGHYFLALRSSEELPVGLEFICDSFQVLLNFGEDILKFCSKHSNKFFTLQYNSSSRSVTFQLESKNPNLDVFLIDSQTSSNEVNCSNSQYLSLNFYFNTIRNENLHCQLIREDKHFQEMYKATPAAKTSLAPSHVLASEYAYYVVLIDSIRSFSMDEISIQENDPCKALQSAWNQYSESRFEKLEALKKELPSIISKKFELVVHKIEKKYGDRKNLKQNDNFESFAQNLVLWLIHAEHQSAQDDSFWKFINDKMSDEFNDFRTCFNNWKETVLCKISETFKIVNDLFPRKKEESGHMKIIRVEKIDVGKTFQEMLVYARKIGFSDKDTYPFEIVRLVQGVDLDHEDNRDPKCLDIWKIPQQMKCSFYDRKRHEKCTCETFICKEKEFSCSNCSHLHKDLKLLSDLERLPVIVILVDQYGRGTTLPLSFDVLDLRLTHYTTFVPFVQQLGRMCQYRERMDYQCLPYALVVPELMETLKKTLKTSAVFNDCTEYIKRDIHTTKKNKPTPNSTDCGNEKIDINRLLLWAEPQIGKTGAYLNLISRLRKTIENPTEGEEEISSDLSSSDENTSDLSDDEEDTSEKKRETKDKWEYPYWNFMITSNPLDKTIGKSKYDRKFESYKYGESPRLKSQHSQDQVPKSKNKAKQNIKERKIDMSDEPVACCYNEHSCSDCKPEAWVVTANSEMNGIKEPVKICIPALERFKPLLNKLNVGSLEKKFKSLKVNEESRPCLDSWIFNPTYRRATKATINYHHTMSGANYVQILVVRAEEFDTYAECWRTSHAILQLPETMEYESMPGVYAKIDAKTGGIGYARRFIQMFAEHFNLSKIFVLDDNIYRIYQVKFAEQDGKVQHELYSLEKVTFWSVLKHLESFFDCSQSVPVKDKFDRYWLEETYCCNQSNGIHTYTGNPNLYGILGVMKFRPQRVCLQGFKRVHVHSLVLLNIPKLKSKKIKYKPFCVYEDLDINNQCDEEGVIVCKFNKYRMVKKQLKSNIMNEDKKLCKKTTNAKSIGKLNSNLFISFINCMIKFQI